MSPALLLLATSFGLVYGILAVILLACIHGKGLVTDLVELAVTFGLIADSLLRFSWIPTPKRVTDAAHLVNSQLEGLTLVAAIIIVAVLTALAFKWLGLVGKLAKLLTAWGTALCPDWGKDD